MSASRERIIWLAGACLAVSVSLASGYAVSPYPSFFNQDGAVLGWGIFLLAIAARIPGGVMPRSSGARALGAALSILLVMCLASSLVTHAPWTMSLSAAGVIFAGLVAVVGGAHVARAGLAITAFESICVALVIAGVVNVVAAFAQVLFPDLTGSGLIARLTEPGRAVGNVRQPNHLGSILLWAIVAAAFLASFYPQRKWLLWLAALFLYGIVLTASRTAALALLGLCAWGFLDHRLTIRIRWVFRLSPLAYAAMWAVTTAWLSGQGARFGGLNRFEHSSVLFTSRSAVWSDVLVLIREHPWTGVGFGGFNFAWMLTPFPHRPLEGFTHTHNIVLNLFVEFGVPVAVVLCGLLSFALWRAVRTTASTEDPALRSARRSALAIVAIIALHSLLEYPLWHAYFLLPTAFLLGLCLEPAESSRGNASRFPNPPPNRALAIFSLALILFSAYAYIDYNRVARAFLPAADVSQLTRQVAEGRRSPLFGHYADYAAATLAATPGSAMPAFDYATRHVLDPELMIAWSQALEASGQTDKARYVAQRLREFEGIGAHPFFAACKPARAASAPVLTMPYQCGEPSKSLRYEDFK